jgi:hypothetical protein
MEDERMPVDVQFLIERQHQSREPDESQFGGEGEKCMRRLSRHGMLVLMLALGFVVGGTSPSTAVPAQTIKVMT